MSQADHDLRIDYVEFRTTDIGAMKAFYGEVFGWKMTDYGPEYTSFEDGRITGGFRLSEQVPQGGPLVVIYAVDLENAEARVREHSGRIVEEIFSFPGGRRFEFLDPAGNRLAVWSDK